MADEAKERMKVLVGEMVAARKETNRLRLDEEVEEKLGAPATPQQIAELERALGKPLPPSYKAFLQLHNGWDEFEGDFQMLSVEDRQSPMVKARSEEMGAFFPEQELENPFATWGFLIALGETSGRLAFLDPRTVGADGEMELVTFEYTQEEDRFPTFADFFVADLALQKRIVEKLRQGVENVGS
jgi:hypothetical protein